VSQYQKVKTNLDFTEARDSEWQWHPPGHLQVCTSLQSDNHASTPPLIFLQAGCPSCHPTNSVKALKALYAEPWNPQYGVNKSPLEQFDYVAAPNGTERLCKDTGLCRNSSSDHEL